MLPHTSQVPHQMYQGALYLMLFQQMLQHGCSSNCQRCQRYSNTCQEYMQQCVRPIELHAVSAERPQPCMHTPPAG